MDDSAGRYRDSLPVRTQQFRFDVPQIDLPHATIHSLEEEQLATDLFASLQ
ncbi:hypothetical protein PGT21_011553 [Puccinia graminis f. sp. tritici]|uniref:Uncharacterized protein n=1 Tax=Puccinia graminis f. sp. tritici TaxID=56615 RepID=A0A5B0QUI8_PUCGR|nr:hypothetical protein PGT21_011553 [Puccinia graminis f. sp. tritici]